MTLASISGLFRHILDHFDIARADSVDPGGLVGFGVVGAAAGGQKWKQHQCSCSDKPNDSFEVHELTPLICAF
ncbi:MAG: hypothetical protein ACOYXC_00485, partial [Candidatus Rifleibacteriota bacterium]